jgi:amino acid transporter
VAYLFNYTSLAKNMPKARRKTGNKTKEKEIRFLGHEILLTFIGALVLSLGISFTTIGLKPAILSWIFSALIIWLGLLIFLFPIVKKIEHLM